MSIIATILLAANFVTPNMTLRNGLTDAQYEALWKIGKNPQIEQAAAREWIFRSARFENVTNWLGICGKTNDFARLSFALQEQNFGLAETNRILVATNDVLFTRCETLVERVTSLTNQLSIAEAAVEVANEKIQGELDDLNAKIVKYTEYQTKYPLLTTVWAALISDAQNRIKVLEALTK